MLWKSSWKFCLRKRYPQVRMVTWKTSFRKTNHVHIYTIPHSPTKTDNGPGAHRNFIKRGEFRHQLVWMGLTVLEKGSHTERGKEKSILKKKRERLLKCQAKAIGYNKGFFSSQSLTFDYQN